MKNMHSYLVTSREKTTSEMKSKDHEGRERERERTIVSHKEYAASLLFLFGIETLYLSKLYIEHSQLRKTISNIELGFS